MRKGRSRVRSSGMIHLRSCPGTTRRMAGTDSLCDIFSKPTGQADSPSPEVLAKQGFSATTIETLIALKVQSVSACADQLTAVDPHSYPDVGHTTVTHGETLDILANFDSDSHSFVTRDELRRRRWGRCQEV